MALSMQQIRDIVDVISYKPEWVFDLGADVHGRPFIQIVVNDGICAVTGLPSPWKSAKHWISAHMCSQEVVGICYEAVRDAESHEMRELFRYGGRSIYNPHISPLALWRLMGNKDNLVMRENAMTMEEPTFIEDSAFAPDEPEAGEELQFDEAANDDIYADDVDTVCFMYGNMS